MIELLLVVLSAAIGVTAIGTIAITAQNDWLSRQTIARRLDQIRGH